MKEIFITEWIWKKQKSDKDSPNHLSIRIPDDIRKIKIQKGNYLIKIYRLESEIKL